MTQSKIAVIYASTYGHVRTLAEAIKVGVEKTGAEVTIFQIPEILSAEVLAKQHAAPKADYPEISAHELPNFDGFLFGFPTRYGRASGTFSAWADTTGAEWFGGKLIGKMAGFFVSTAGQHGGQETTVLTSLPFLAHHGMTYVPLGYGNPLLSDLTEIVGGSAWGAAAIAGGDGSRAVSAKELALAEYQGAEFAKYVTTFVTGKAAQAAQVAAAPAVAASTDPIAASALPVIAATEATPYAVDATIPASEADPALAVAPPAVVPGTSMVTETEKAPAAVPAPVDAKKAGGGGGFFSMCCGGNKDNYQT